MKKYHSLFGKIVYLLLMSAVCLLPIGVSAQTQKTYSFRGKLGQNISFRLDLEQNADGIIAGETTYFRKNGKIAKLPVYGWIMGPQKQGYWNGNVLSLTEYDGTNECGNFMIALSDKDEVAEGHWSFGPDEDNFKEYDINSVEQTVFPEGTTYFHPAKGTEISGEYRWGLPASGGLHYVKMGSCELSNKAGKVHYNISAVLPGIAEDENDTVLKGSYFTGQKEEYQFKAYVDRNFVAIWTTQNAQVEDWGAWTSLEGIYLKH